MQINWYMNDVKQVRPDLDDSQAMRVLSRAMDCGSEINWALIKDLAQKLYPREAK